MVFTRQLFVDIVSARVEAISVKTDGKCLHLLMMWISWRLVAYRASELCLRGVGGNGMSGGTIVTVGLLLFPEDPFCLSLGAAQIHEPRFLFKLSAIWFQREKYFTTKKIFHLHFFCNRKGQSLQWEPKRFQLRHQSRLRIRWIFFRLTNCPIRCLAKEGLLCLLLQKIHFLVAVMAFKKNKHFDF